MTADRTDRTDDRTADMTDDRTASARSLGRVAKDALLVGVGLGLISVQRAQVHRREITRLLGPRVAEARDALAGATGQFDPRALHRVKDIEARLHDAEERLEALLDQIEEKLPPAARSLARQARSVARDAAHDARHQLRDLAARQPPAA